MSLISSLFDSSERFLRSKQGYVTKINALEPEYEKFSDDQIKSEIAMFREEIKNGAKLDDYLARSFALTREAAKRTLGQRHFDVQLLGGMALHFNKIAEMRTGEGKTLTATLAAVLNSLDGQGVHVVTVNDYLAKRDAEWMGKIYNFLGLTVGCIHHDASYEDRRKSYWSDITYGTNNEFGFDYLRDNMAIHPTQLVQRVLNYAIVDEVDSILIDEARTPLIISGPAEESTELYGIAAKAVKKLSEDDYVIDEKDRNVTLTEKGVTKVESILSISNLYGPENVETARHVAASLKAHHLFKNDVDYIVKDDEIIIVDEFTGRLMYGRRYSDGLHQAIEAKEGISVKQENQTLATITFQNYFRLFNKLSGMTGTAKTEENEFREIYGLEVVVVPTNRPTVRNDHADVVWKNEKVKFNKIIDEVVDCHKTGQPVLVGTRSIEKSEMLSKALLKKNIPHEVLNAKYHEKEAAIIAKAGQVNAVTIATNMAGRGVDIMLAPGVKELGGLHIIGTERHESRRIDNQLRGRSGRQGDPGSTRFHLALDDELLRIFGGERLQGMFSFLKIEEDVPLEHALLTRTIENSQKKVENRNFDIRKYVLEYDNVLNKQREVIYDERRRVLDGEDLRETTLKNIGESVRQLIDINCPASLISEEWKTNVLMSEIMDYTAGAVRTVEYRNREELVSKLTQACTDAYLERENRFTPVMMREIERYVLLHVVDQKWKDHLYSMDNLREGIHLRSFAQKNPLQEYQQEAFAMFNQMLASIWEETGKLLFRVELQQNTPPPPPRNVGRTNEDSIKEAQKLGQLPPEEDDGGYSSARPTDSGHATNAPLVRNQPKVGRNDPCPCGSGKKYKNCCGRNE
jgi:preprotein translocase subunit SecA